MLLYYFDKFPSLIQLPLNTKSIYGKSAETNLYTELKFIYLHKCESSPRHLSVKAWTTFHSYLCLIGYYQKSIITCHLYLLTLIFQIMIDITLSNNNLIKTKTSLCNEQTIKRKLNIKPTYISNISRYSIHTHSVFINLLHVSYKR